jgi:hypothetical protein
VLFAFQGGQGVRSGSRGRYSGCCRCSESFSFSCGFGSGRAGLWRGLAVCRSGRFRHGEGCGSGLRSLGYRAVSGRIKSAPPTASGVRGTRHPGTGAAQQPGGCRRSSVLRECPLALEPIPSLAFLGAHWFQQLIESGCTILMGGYGQAVFSSGENEHFLFGGVGGDHSILIWRCDPESGG